MLVGPATRAATEGIFHWGPHQKLSASVPTPKPLTAAYLGRPRAPTRSSDGPTCAPVPPAHGWPRRRASSHGGGGGEQAISGRGSVVFIVGGTRPWKEPAGARMPGALHGLGRSRHGPAAACGWRSRIGFFWFFDASWSLPATAFVRGLAWPPTEAEQVMYSTLGNGP